MVLVVLSLRPAPIGTKVPTQVLAACCSVTVPDRVACPPPQVMNRPILPSRAPTAARPTVGAARCPVAAPIFLETCDHDLTPLWGRGRREGHTGGAWPVAINVPPIFAKTFERLISGKSRLRANSEHPGGVPFACMHHTEGGVVARLMCPSASALLGQTALRLLRARTCLGAAQ